MTPKNIHKIFIPQKILFFLKTQKRNGIQNFEPQKMTRAYLCMKISETPALSETNPRHCEEESQNTNSHMAPIIP